MDWFCLTESKENFTRGTVFRTAANWPYEDIVDFMLIEDNRSASNYSLIVSSGYKAGSVILDLPAEAIEGSELGINAEWMKTNWQKWIYESDPNQVYVLDCYRIEENWTPSKTK